jgi:hypothetical protein
VHDVPRVEVPHRGFELLGEPVASRRGTAIGASLRADLNIINPVSVHVFTFFERIIDIHSRFLFILSE